MSGYASKHIPGLAGATSSVPAATGTLIVDTGLMDLKSFTATLAQDAVANAASVSWELVTRVPNTTQQVTLKVWKADGATAASVVALVSWIAMGR